MHITYLGHAGFCIETEEAIVIVDPWVSPTGAFDASWFQLPRNHHMAAYVQEKLQDARKERYLYISHEHKDHCDPSFLRSLTSRDFTLVLPKFRRDALRRMFADYRCKGMVLLEHQDVLPIPGGTIQMFLDDHEISRDSAILVRAGGHSFLNLNDCKIHDQLPGIVAASGAIDVFTAQFSGAVWHPTCYDYPKKRYEAISRKKLTSKFEAVARAIEAVQPKLYLSSAGPACFLDPLLYPINFEQVNIFPRAAAFFDFLKKRLPDGQAALFEPMPGDTLDVAAMRWVHLSQERLTEENFAAYLQQYAALYEGFFQMRRRTFTAAELEGLWEKLREALLGKLANLTLHDRIKVPLYFCLTDAPDRMLRVDFVQKQVEFSTAILEKNHYSIKALAGDVARVLDDKLIWEDFALSFRLKLNREPDIFQALIYGFLMLEAEDMNYYCAKVLHTELNQERTIVEAGGCRYSVNRFCPHLGADLSQGWLEQDKFLTCPRHRWQFDLTDKGACTTNDSSIHAFPLEDD